MITPWDNVWLDYYNEIFTYRGHRFFALHPHHMEQFAQQAGADLYLHGWASGDSQPVAGATNVMFLRSYELFQPDGLKKVEWGALDALICVNPAFQRMVQAYFADHAIKVPVHCIFNGTPLQRWTFKPRVFNGKIGMACHVHWKKNIPLALQVLAKLPSDTELHIAGEIQDPCTQTYIEHVSALLKRKVVMYGHIDIGGMDAWWEQFGVMLSTSLREGNPNNVIEAMAKGIKPVIHNWLGADEQFPGLTFLTPEEGAAMVSGPIDSERYRSHVADHFSLANIAKVVSLCEELGRIHT